jgi:hypothetical protein
MRMIRFLVMFAAFAFAGVTNVLMVLAGTYTDGKSMVVLAVAIAAMAVGLYLLERKAGARTNGGNH